jgi:2-keto-4-pentenoate hydratase/2-oxohepta-3-ene-1,7-dioic acid hydratase in catechol pathway
LLIRVCDKGQSFDAGSGEELGLEPGKIVGIGVNYRAHAVEMGKTPPDEPILFLKPSTAVIADGESIVRPAGYERVDFEAELAVVIGTRCRRVAPENALDFVLGITCLNDVTVRDLQKLDGQWARAKGFDTFCPIGPRIVRDLDPTDLRVVSRVNGQVRQDSRTSDMIVSVPELISFASRSMTLEVGDVITTGTPSGVGNLSPGDVVEIEIEGVGVLRNPVVGE